MRPFELAALVWTAPTFGLLLASSKKLLRWAAVVGLVVVAAQIAIEGPRWQMYPEYAAATGLAACAFSVSARRISIILGLEALGLALCSAFLCWLLPVFSLPQPAGPYGIGTVTATWIRDASRAELAPHAIAHRRLIVQFWYPVALSSRGEFAPYRANTAASFRARYLRLVKTHARIGAQVASAPRLFPLVLFSPMWNSGRSQNTVQFEMLASHGFVVAAVESPLDSPEGDFEYWSDAKIHEKDQQLEARTEDIRFALDQLGSLDRGAPAGILRGRLDLNEVGILGHSFGGAAAAEACWSDPRFKAGINMDGNLFGQVADAGVRQPFLFVYSDTKPTGEQLNSPDARERFTARMDLLDWQRSQRSLERYGGYVLIIRGTSHVNYTDRGLFSPWKRLTGAGPIKPLRAEEILNAYILAFFDEYLKGRPEPLLDAAGSTSREISFQRVPRLANRSAQQPAHR